MTRPEGRERGRRARGSATRPAARRESGRRGEALAHDALEAHGYRVLARNLHFREAELDLLALEGRTLCFVEVRLRASDAFGSAEASIDARKRRRLVRAARIALATLALPAHDFLRFDVVAIDTSLEPPDVRIVRDAFYADER